jgi:hypothetical protein
MCAEPRIENALPKTENENEGAEARVQARVRALSIVKRVEGNGIDRSATEN